MKAFPMKKWIRVVRVNKVDVDRFKVDEGDSFDLYDLIGKNKLEL